MTSLFNNTSVPARSAIAANLALSSNGTAELVASTAGVLGIAISRSVDSALYADAEQLDVLTAGTRAYSIDVSGLSSLRVVVQNSTDTATTITLEVTAV